MSTSFRYHADVDGGLLWEDGELLLCRGWFLGDDGQRNGTLVLLPVAEQPSSTCSARLAHEFELRDELDAEWAVKPLHLIRDGGRPRLVLEDPGGEPLERLLRAPMGIGAFLRLAIGIAATLAKVHQRGLVHKDIKPAHILVHCPDGHTRLTGFGLASHLPRERQAPAPPETITGTLAYMAPEQTGRMNRSIDLRSDLYSLGITFYRMLTGSLPFKASEPVEWVHSHIARRPVSPGERRSEIPAALSQIVMKLLAKTAEERYQSAAGMERDLQHCLMQWQREQRIDDIPLGRYDTTDQLLIPEKLYGRAREVATLLSCFDRVATSTGAQLVLVRGSAGIGKSSVVNELQKTLSLSGGLFASGKSDQFKRDIPYETLARALRGLILPLLSKSEEDLATWRRALHTALEPNAGVIADLIPELRLIIGNSSTPAQIDPQQTHARFQLVFRQFIAVFARPGQPLAIFLDDLQWLDFGTLDLLEDLLTRPEVEHLLLVGAYRDNETDANHPLMRKLEAIRRGGARLEEIRLMPLARDEIGELIAETLHCAPQHAAPLVRLIEEKTAGNPLFVHQFLHSLADERLLTFEPGTQRWGWDLERIRGQGYTDNVVDLMVGKLNRLPPATQQALQQFACIGNVASVEVLAAILQTAEEQVHEILRPALHHELLGRLERSYSFAHDRIQEAAYSLIHRDLLAANHLRIGRLLAQQPACANLEEAIFDIVNQLNRGAQLIEQPEERERVAELNLLAGKRAKGSTAYLSALTYLNAGAALLAVEGWERGQQIRFELELSRAECEFLTGRATLALERLTVLLPRATTSVERAALACLRMAIHTNLNQHDRAVAVCLDYLRQVGVDWSPHPAEDQVRHEYERVGSLVGVRAIEALLDLPLMQDPESLATIDVLTKVHPSALLVDVNLAFLTICRAVSLSIERGNCDASCVAYVLFGARVGRHFGEPRAGFSFGQLGLHLAERRGLSRYAASIYELFAYFITPWMNHVRESSELLRRAFDTAKRMGDLTYATFACCHLNVSLLFAGAPLIEVQREVERSLAFAEGARSSGLIVVRARTQLAFVQMLRGLLPSFGKLDSRAFSEHDTEEGLSGNRAMATIACLYWMRILQARYLAGDYQGAMDASARLTDLPWMRVGAIEEADYHLYSALTHTACYDGAAPVGRARHLKVLATHHTQLRVWSESCPQNFHNRTALVAAEMARVEGRALEAMELYEDAIRSAQANGFVQVEAVASELAGRFYSGRGFEKIARTYLDAARSCYVRWGADGKVRQFEQLYPQCNAESRGTGPAGTTIETSLEHLDLATVINMSQAVSSEIVLDKLIDSLMRTAITQAGAARGLLILAHAAEPRVAAQASTVGDSIHVEPCDVPVSGSVLPQMVLSKVLRTRESVILDDAESEAPYAADPYISSVRARSILCVPLINQAKLVGVFYLENDLAARVFVPQRITVVKLLASQAAVALENSRLYRELAEREARIRRLVDANIIGIFIYDRHGGILEANEAFLGMVGYDRQELLSGRIHWQTLTPPDRKDIGTMRPLEMQLCRRDGSRVPVLVGAADFEPDGNQGVAFVLDLTERKQAERAAQESERRYHDLNLQLAHANRVLSIGELSASIAHEINQPLAGIIVNADTGLSMLDDDPPNLGIVRETISRTIRDANRASAVIIRLRALFANKETQFDALDLNQLIRDVAALSMSETNRMGVELRLQLQADLPPVRGDLVQLQQVVLNLLRNGSQAMANVEERRRVLTISTELAHPEGAVVTVQDVGVGFDSEREAKLFQAFYTTKSDGMGIGLSVSRSIIAHHRGRIWAQRNDGPGATFAFVIPLA